MLISAANSTSVLTVTVLPIKALQSSPVSSSTRGDVVSISNAAAATSQGAAALPTADQAAETMRGQFRSVEAAASMLNDMQSSLDQSTKPENFTDEMYAKVLSDMHAAIQQTKESLATGIQGLKDRYNASGDFPSQQSDGTWSQGSYSGSASGNGYALKAESSNTILISKNGGAFTKWSENSTNSAAKASSSASVALEMMKKMTSVDYKA